MATRRGRRTPTGLAPEEPIWLCCAGCEAVTGTCCDHDPFGGCTDGLTRAECNCGRCEWTEVALCDDVECPRDSIPTVGAWGLAILSLLLMTGAKVRFGRLQQT
ncbi:MAG: hypothetical protein V1790_17905 [Planctomycetota bacterium]